MSATNGNGITLVDAHVHIYRCFDVSALLTAAYANFEAEARKMQHDSVFVGMLFLTESSGFYEFNRLARYAESSVSTQACQDGIWHFIPTAESHSLIARSTSGRELILVAGRQIVTAEKLELLALATSEHLDDGMPIREAVAAIVDCGAIPVAPWGVGKWLGERGNILRDLVDRSGSAEIFVGDNSGRPVFWPRPKLLSKPEDFGLRVLSGTDPLPIPSEEGRCGSFGVILDRLISIETPIADFVDFLGDTSTHIRQYGDLESPAKFFRNQLKLRFGRGLT